MKHHGLKLNVVDANETRSEHGGKFGGNQEPGKGGGGGGGGGKKSKGVDGKIEKIVMKGAYGGSYWSQLDTEDFQEWQDFLPRVP